MSEARDKIIKNKYQQNRLEIKHRVRKDPDFKCPDQEETNTANECIDPGDVIHNFLWKKKIEIPHSKKEGNKGAHIFMPDHPDPGHICKY